MLTILGITAPIFLLIALGYGAIRLGAFRAEEMRVLGRFVMLIALPATFFRAIADRPIAELASGRYLAAYALGSLAAFAVAFAWFRARRADDGRAGVLALGMSVSNTAFVGLPVVTQFLGPAATAAVAMTVLVENFVVILLGLAISDGAGGKGRGWRATIGDTLARLARTPMILGIVAGAVVSISGLPVPPALRRAIDMLAGASAPAALFVIGGTLAGISVRGMALDVAAVAAGKLMLHPFAVAMALLLLAPAAPLVTAGIVLAASPMLSIYPILGQRHGVEQLAAAALVVATVASFATISLLLWLLGST